MAGSQIVESATVHVLADLLAKDNCALLADEPKMALQIVRPSKPTHRSIS